MGSPSSVDGRSTATLVAKGLLETRIITAAAPAYLQRHGRPEEPRDLESGDHVCIQFRDPETGRPLPWEFHPRRKKIVFTSRGQLTINEAGTMHSVCVAGHGIGQILERGAELLLLRASS